MILQETCIVNPQLVYFGRRVSEMVSYNISLVLYTAPLHNGFHWNAPSTLLASLSDSETVRCLVSLFKVIMWYGCHFCNVTGIVYKTVVFRRVLILFRDWLGDPSWLSSGKCIFSMWELLMVSFGYDPMMCEKAPMCVLESFTGCQRHHTWFYYIDIEMGWGGPAPAFLPLEPDWSE